MRLVKSKRGIDIVDEHLRVRRRIELRDDADPVILRVILEISVLILRIIAVFRSQSFDIRLEAETGMIIVRCVIQMDLNVAHLIP